MSDEDTTRNTKRVLISLIAVMILLIAAGMWFVSSKIADTANQNREDKLVEEAQKSAEAEEKEAKKQDTEETEDPSQSKGDGSGLPGVDEDDREVTGDTSDFGKKLDGIPDFGERNNYRVLENTGDLEYYIGVSSKEQDDMSNAFETDKGYIVIDLDNGYYMVVDSFNQSVFAVVSKDGNFTDDQLSMFRETFESADETTGTGIFDGMSIITKGDPVDLTE